ncbi:MAG TPA: 3-isopropylmalate dehydratase small subunit [Longimicrobiales bacterium]|nr:3-isopropylmalate dehydratase small subunit [Longimicrobiales bacterium]
MSAQEREAPVFVRHTGIAAPFLRHNVDTDVISPLNPNPILPGASVGERAFEGIRYFQDGTENPDFFINQEPYRRASIMLTGRNFGTGSSRATGVTWPMAMGIRVVISPSFGPIFETNAFQFGLLAVPLELEVIEQLAAWVEANPGVEMTVDLEREVIEAPGLRTVNFEMDPRIRRKLLEGLDDLEEIQEHTTAARAMRSEDRGRRPWIYQTQGNDNP